MSDIWSCPCCTFDNACTASECIVCGAVNYKVVMREEKRPNPSYTPPPHFPPSSSSSPPQQQQQQQREKTKLTNAEQLEGIEFEINKILSEFEEWQKSIELSNSKFDLEKYVKRIKVTSELLFQQQLKLDGVMCNGDESIKQRRRNLTKVLVEKVGFLDSCISGK